MPRIRSIHPDLHRDKTVATLTASAERTFVRLWCHLDDEGRGEDDPLLLKADLYPRHTDMGPDEVERDLAELADAGLIIRYVVDGEPHLCCKPSTWANYQRPQKKQESKLPGPEQADEPAATGPVRDRSRTTTRPVPPVGEGRGVGGEKELAPTEPSRRTRQPDLIFDAVVEHCGYDPASLTASARGAINKAVADLKAVDATPQQVSDRARNYRAKWPDQALTAPALAKHWPQLVAKRQGGSPGAFRQPEVGSPEWEARQQADLEMERRVLGGVA